MDNRLNPALPSGSLKDKYDEDFNTYSARINKFDNLIKKEVLARH